ncbi:MAG: hypothetical protein K6B41_09350, partial [Butyrivibrio sp.]|nr:hypothetical protein [Butyrivibrio sp.]
MTSKRLFVDLCDENRKRRLWPIALSITGNFFAQIVFAFILMSNCEDRLKWDIGVTWAELQSGFFVNVSGLGSIPILLIVFGLALINALNGFGYLFDSRLSDLYGALPVRREKQFDAVCFNGIVIFVIPFVVCHIFTIVVATAKGFVTISSLPLYVLCMLITIILYVLAYMVYVLAAIMTGHVVVAALASGVFTLIGPAVYYGIQ